IQYHAAVPLFENTMTWDNGEPAVTGAQAANLNNNNGPSTRHGLGDDYEDAQSYTNTVFADGTYTGPVETGGYATSDSDSVIIDAVDLRILKSVDNAVFTTNGLALFSLQLDTSEYTSAS